MKVKKCFGCIAVDKGVMILGVMIWLGLLAEVIDFNPIRAAVAVVAGTHFLLMV